MTESKWLVRDNNWLPPGEGGVARPYLEIPKEILAGMEFFARSGEPQDVGGGYFQSGEDKIFRRVGGTDAIPVLEEIEVREEENKLRDEQGVTPRAEPEEFDFDFDL